MIREAGLSVLMTVAIFILAATSQVEAVTTTGIIDFSHGVDNSAYDTDLVDGQFGPDWWYEKNDHPTYLGGLDVAWTNDYRRVYIDLSVVQNDRLHAFDHQFGKDQPFCQRDGAILLFWTNVSDKPYGNILDDDASVFLGM